MQPGEYVVRASPCGFRPTDSSMLLHGSCAVYKEVGLLIRGPSGSGKSDLLLRLMGQGFDLVSDDYVIVENGYARPPERLGGLIAVRGLGIYKHPYRAMARLHFVVEPSEQRTRIMTRRLCVETNLPVITVEFVSSVCVSILQLAAAYFAGEVTEVAGPLSDAART